MNLPNGPSRDQIVAAARTWLGTPYVHQASAKGAGTDCLGLVRGLWRELYGAEPEVPPPYTPDWIERHGDERLIGAANRWMVARTDGALLPGDVVLFRIMPGGPAKHMGVLTGDDRFIHAYAGRSVCESWLSRWWKARIAGLYVFPGVQ
ncbi:NlpC/P60 family protein [Aquisalinus flavus]|uniref:NlpC/P60 domain-containing protein n=1 Tax=Aquisalinus flavus TaxID=1526572 RepID=A0A8J2V2Y8_9PROT|nr:NlpC/P60 family protein [Aquisalinus flavus]MBD0426295.1 C40 family peptidase [Aquisalinus flavus]UNE48137.1 peptidase P60 [Aquisalinus flavus]GGD09099.1 hypothetical protein GCM10011342_17420 [Aquisalinus flavus]